MPMEFPTLADGTNPTALYNCCKQVIVMILLQLASTVTPETLSTMGSLLLAGARASFSAVLTLNIVDFCFLNLLNIVVGWMRSMWSCRLLGRL